MGEEDTALPVLQQLLLVRVAIMGEHRRRPVDTVDWHLEHRVCDSAKEEGSPAPP